MTFCKRVFLSWKCAFSLTGLYALLLAFATFVENICGTAMARKLVYNQPLCYLLLLVLVIQFLAMSWHRQMWKGRRIGPLLLHVAFVVILLGAWVTAVSGVVGQIHIREGEESDVLCGSRGQVIDRLPFRILLEDFRLVRYPGSNSPSSYESFVVIKHEGERRKAHIYMNNVATVQGYRIFQSSYDGDEMGTILTVNHDPWGMGITYAGYILLLTGMLWTILDRRSHFRLLCSKLKGHAWLLACLFPLSAVAAETGGEMPLHTIPQAQVERWSMMLVRSGEGRIEPFNTYASTLLRKFCREVEFEGLAPEQVILGIVLDPAYWSEVPLLRQSDKTLALHMGIPVEKRIPFAALFDEQGGYRLAERVEQVYARAVDRRTKEERNLLKLDEKANIFYALMRGELLAFFPTPDGSWCTAADDLSCFRGEDSLLVARFLPMYADAVLQQRNPEMADKLMNGLGSLQQRYVTEELPSEKHIRGELFYNKARIFFVSAVGYMSVGLCLLVMSIVLLLLGRPWQRKGLKVLVGLAVCLFLWHTFGLALRWYIAGRAPWSNAYETMVYVAWATVSCGLLFVRRSALAFSSAVFFAGILLFVSNLNFMDPEITPLVPVLKSYWLMIHVAVITASYGFFGMSFLLGLLSLVLMIAGRWNAQLGSRLAVLRVIGELSMYIGLFLLTAGIFLGAVWANESWGRYWGWDPKEAWALITMLVYAIVLHTRFLPWKCGDYAFAVMSVYAALSVVMTYWGVNYFFSGLHSYGGGEMPVGTWIVWLVFVGAGVMALLARGGEDGRGA